MPHLNVRMYAGRSDAEKRELADRLTQVVTETLGYGDEAVSVAIEDVAPKDWMDGVYRTDIAAHPDRLFKRPGYGPLADED